MKNLYLIAAILCSFYTSAQVSVAVDPSIILKTLNGKENGINLNYLTDDAYTDSRTTTTASLKQMGIKMLRYPGGEKSDNYFFSAYPWNVSSPRMASKDKRSWPTNDKRFIDVNSASKVCLSNVLDFDEMVQMAKAIEAEPLIVVSYDVMYLSFSDNLPVNKPTKKELLEHAIEWVRYSNIKKGYKIKYWMIGNESWNNPDYNGRTTAAQYAADIVEFAKAMKEVDPSIQIIANGKSDWWPTLLQSPAASWIDILAFSNYPVWQYAGGYSYFKNKNVNLTEEADTAIKAIETFASPADRDRIKVLPSEYNSIDWSGYWANDNNLGHALCNFQMFGDLILKPKLESMCMWNTRWTEVVENPQSIYDALDKSGNLNANGKAQEVWGKNLLHKMVSAASSDVYVKTYATYDTINKALNIFILNKDSISKKVDVTLQNYVRSFGGARFSFSGTGVDDKFPTYKWEEAISDPLHLSQMTIAPTSVTVIKLITPFIHLPLNILNFKAQVTKSKAALTWQVVNEEEVEEYIVEKQYSKGNFKKIGSLPAINQKGMYSFTDSTYSPGLDAAYRLRVFFKDGATTYSKIVYLNSNSEVPDLKAIITPNPITGPLVFQLSSVIHRKVEVRVLNQQGSILFSQKKKIEKGSQYIQIPEIAHLPKSNYWLQIIDGSMVSSIAFLKQ